MNQAHLRAPWEYSKLVASLAPVTNNAAQNGASIDRTGYDSLIADYVVANAGGPNGGTLTLQLQDSADGVNFANFGSPVTPSILAGIAALAIDIRGARQFVRVVSTAAPTGGTSSVATVGGTARLFGPVRLPAL